MISTNEHKDICMNGTLLEAVDKLEYLGVILSSKDKCVADIRVRLATATAAMSKLTGCGGATRDSMSNVSSTDPCFAQSCYIVVAKIGA
ncbi:hypothetical protein ElyMa_003555200 [Elysia marginata]|uniref:Reverse transcriptase domain-containing protein n=1 Tax=Elysia marginata TaxID=1093978 RepID=A0AAV4ELM8_9GAST|nr:hypothetical protein ElyMa_003555200 [Elysia marginata]